MTKLRLFSLILLLSCISGCFEKKVGTPIEQLLQTLFKHGFTMEPHKVDVVRVKKFPGYLSSQCNKAIHEPTVLFACLHEFKDGRQALEAGATLAKEKWPKGRYWALTVRGETLIIVDSRMHDRPVADKLVSVFKNFVIED